MRTIEAFLAILLLFSAFAITTLISPASNFDDDNALTTLGMQTLISMDNDGQLGRLIDERNWTTLADALDTLLPVGTSYNLTVYSRDMQPINNISISNGLISNQNVVSIQYPCASPTSQSSYYLLRLQLAIAK
jgi:hypothetical protein